MIKVTQVERGDDYVEVFYEREGRDPGHSHIIPDEAIWARMAEDDISADEAVAACILEAHVPGSPRLRGQDLAREKSARPITGLGKAKSLLVGPPDEFTAAFKRHRERRAELDELTERER